MLIRKLFPILLILAITACSGNAKKAQEILDSARVSYEAGALNKAKVQIDSMRNAFPKEFDAIKQGLQLMREIELKENERTLVYTDSLLKVREVEAAELEKAFVFEKDPQYEELGNYIFKGMNVERNIERCYIRTGVNEYGEMYIASVYYGKGNINHTGIKVEIKDGSNAETVSIPYDGGTNYRFSDNGSQSEIVTYKKGNDNGVISFIDHYKDDRIKVSYTGGKPYVIYLDDFSKKAISKTYELATVLTDITRLKQENKVATGKIEFLQKRINEKNMDLTTQ